MPSKARGRVLYVDNDDDTCEMICLLFGLHKIEVTCADSAFDASLKIQSGDFDLMMLDAWLPGQDGVEFCREFRRSDSSTPILFYSGAAYEADIRRGLAAGADAYLVKPDIDGLTQVVLGLLEKQRGKKVDLTTFEGPRLSL